MKSNIKAFTLIELLVVIFIIGILATLAIISLQQARISARDVKRVADVRQVQTALELYFNDNGRYPTPSEWNSGQILSPDTGKTFLEEIPSAPATLDGSCTSADYVYNVDANGSTYTIEFCTGRQVAGLDPGDLCATPAGINTCSLLPAGPGVFTCGNPFTDPRDGKTYNTTQIGSQCWMAESLKHDNGCRSTTWQNSSDPSYTGWCGCYANEEVNCDNYGYLYQWVAAVEWNGVDDIYTLESTQGICPDGWHLPSDAEVIQLEEYLGMCSGTAEPCSGYVGYRGTNQGVLLKSARTEVGDPAVGISTNEHPRWDYSATNYGTDDYGFAMLSTGFRSANGTFYALHEEGTDPNNTGFIWTSTAESTGAWIRYFLYDNPLIRRFNHWRTDAISVRCVQD